MWRKSVFSRKETFSSFQKPSLQKWRAQNMAVAAGRLACYLIQVPRIDVAINDLWDILPMMFLISKSFNASSFYCRSWPNSLDNLFLPLAQSHYENICQRGAKMTGRTWNKKLSLYFWVYRKLWIETFLGDLKPTASEKDEFQYRQRNNNNGSFRHIWLILKNLLLV